MQSSLSYTVQTCTIIVPANERKRTREFRRLATLFIVVLKRDTAPCLGAAKYLITFEGSMHGALWGGVSLADCCATAFSRIKAPLSTVYGAAETRETTIPTIARVT
jgi:hypothetical protein